MRHIESGELVTPMEERSIEVLSPEELEEIAKSVEIRISRQPQEVLIAIDVYGNVIAQTNGNKDSAEMDVFFWNLADIVTHNHPQGSSFSGTDVAALYNTAVNEIRVCYADGWQSLAKDEDWEYPEDLDLNKLKTLIDKDMTELANRAAKLVAECTDVTLADAENKAGFVVFSNSGEDFDENIQRYQCDVRYILFVLSGRYYKKFAEKYGLIYSAGTLSDTSNKEE